MTPTGGVDGGVTGGVTAPAYWLKGMNCTAFQLGELTSGKRES